LEIAQKNILGGIGAVFLQENLGKFWGKKFWANWRPLGIWLSIIFVWENCCWSNFSGKKLKP
jgi:hypothetical protein